MFMGRARGFTLIEMLIAIAILAVIAVLSWRGLDQVIRGRTTITNAMEDERVVAQLFDQMRIDARQATTDDQAGQPAISIGGNGLQIVRGVFASPPLANVGEVRRALAGSGSGDDGWSALPLMGGVRSLVARVYIPASGWTTQMRDVASKITENDNNLKVPQLGNAPLPRAVTGIQVAVGAPNLAAPITRVFLVGE